MQLFAIILGFLGLLAFPGLWRTARGTTLTSPWCWALVSGLVILAITIQGASEPLLNYAGACSTFLPAAAVYGAKRPQDRGWQWIVAALMVLLLWPAGESWLLEESFNLPAQPLRSWFLVVLCFVQCGNWIISRNMGPVLLLTAAQVLLLGAQLPWGSQTNMSTWYVGAALLSFVPWWLNYNQRRMDQSAQRCTLTTAFPTTRQLAEWRSFRAAYGVVWALRVTERINEVAKLRHWPWRWSWSGPVPLESKAVGSAALTLPGENQEAVYWEQLWVNIFRRFLDPANLSAVNASQPACSLADETLA
jgi:hypothetical protein